MDIDVKHVTHHEMIDQVSLHIPAGQFVAMMGPAGSGKTTLGQMVAGLIQPQSGVIRVGPYALHQKADRRRLWQALGYLFQFPEHQVIEDTVFQHIRSRKWTNVQVRETMESLGLSYSDFKERSPFQISGGELRRVALAGVMISQPKLLILDEPTAGLDSCERSRALSYIKRLHYEHEMTILHITHRLEEALEYSERILVLNEGRLYADFLPSSIRKEWSQLERIGFVKTPLLRFIDTLEKQSAIELPENIYKEDQLITCIRNFPKEGL